MSAVFVQITATRGSAPRDTGTAMKVTARKTEGTIGGGALEYQAVATARRLLQADGPDRIETIPLGPGLGQCCGGAVTLRYTREACAIDVAPVLRHGAVDGQSHPIPLWLWGAGHVGRAVVAAAPPQAFDITWIDASIDRFPPMVPKTATVLPAADMPCLAARAPVSAHHLIFTYSHDIDLALCGALLRRGAASIGLIGSDTKWARFQKRLTAIGLDPTPITCPIGDKSLGKAPHDIARGLVSEFMSVTPAKAIA